MSRKTIISDFRDAGKMEQSDHLVQNLDYVDRMPEIRRIKERSYEYFCLGEGAVVLDAGFCNDQFPDGSTGRKLYRYFIERNLKDVTVHPEPLLLHDLESVVRLMNMEQFLSAAEEKGVIPEAESRLWMEELRSADEQDRFGIARSYWGSLTLVVNDSMKKSRSQITPCAGKAHGL